MAKPSGLQRYYLSLIVCMRWFGVVFAGGALLITASNLPSALRAKDTWLTAKDLGMGFAFAVVGIMLYRIGEVVERRYRAHIEHQSD